MPDRVAIVCGGRDYRGTDDAADFLANCLDEYSIDTVVHGDAPGADRWAAGVATGMALELRPVPAQWSEHGKAAGPIRNRVMLAIGPVLVVVFPGGNGTAHMRRIAEAKPGVEVVVYQPHFAKESTP